MTNQSVEAAQNLKNQTMSGLKWSALERFASQGIGFLIQILLARILGPEHFGPLVLTVIFSSLGEIIVDNGLSQAIIQAKSIDRRDVSTVFWANAALSCLLYLFFWLTAPSIAFFFNEPIVTDVMRLLMVSLIIGALGRIHMAVMTRQLKFRKLFLISTPAIIIGGATGIALAYSGWGVWALVVQMLTFRAAQTALLWWHSDPHLSPRFLFSIKSLLTFGNFGIYLLGSALIYQGSQHLYSLIIGRMFGTTQLAIFNRAQGLTMKPAQTFVTILNRVLFPVFSSIQHDTDRIRTALRSGIPTLTFFMVPVFALLIVTAKPFVLCILTEKWIDTVPLLSVLPVIGFTSVLSTINLTVYRSLGRSRLILVLSILKNGLGLSLMALALSYGLFYIAAALATASVANLIINFVATERLIGYRVTTQMRDVFPYVAFALVAAGISLFATLSNFPAAWILAAQLTLFATAYLALNWFFQTPGAFEAIKLTRQLVAGVNSATFSRST